MKLLAVRDLNTQDPLPALGPKVERPAPPPPPALRPTATPGVMQRPDGKLETNLPLPDGPIGLHDSVVGPIFSETNKNDWWAFAAADSAKRLKHAHNYNASPKEFRRFFETDFSAVELRVLSAQSTRDVPAAPPSWINEQSIKKFFP